ncbi:MAG: hypothetical protein P8Q87_04425 [Candidatus Poseidonia sp.]|nr:hypothetical protein [Poseidonia sp.]
MPVSGKRTQSALFETTSKRLLSRWLTFKNALRLPIIVWQALFFIAPLIFMVAMSFFIVRNYRMTEAFEMKNWLKMMSRDYFWDSYGLTIGLATLATMVVMTVAFPPQ